MSLKASLNQIIKDRNGGVFTTWDLDGWCRMNGYKSSTAERRLRRSESPDIERMVKDGVIVGYRWIAPQKPESEARKPVILWNSSSVEYRLSDESHYGKDILIDLTVKEPVQKKLL